MKSSRAAQYRLLTKLLMFRREASLEFGEDVASALKLSKDGSKVLWPQPFDDPRDPQNVSGYISLLYK